MTVIDPVSLLFKRIALVGDSSGLAILLRLIPRSSIIAVVAAEVRPGDLPAVSALASGYGLPLLVQPRYSSGGYAAFVEALRLLGPDLLICNSYSMLLRREVLDLVSSNAVNVHASLLPKNRGPNPIQWAIIRGEDVTGVTLHYMSERIDEGDIIAQSQVPIAHSDTWISLRDRVTACAQAMLSDELPRVLAGTNPRCIQDEAAATVNPRLTADSPRIDFARMTDREVYDLIRAQVAPLPGAFVEAATGRERFMQPVALSAIPALREKYA